MKVDNDHGGGSCKTSLQIASLPSPNSKANSIVFGLFEVIDFYTNVAIIARLFQEDVQNLKQMMWRGKEIHVYVFGDCPFLCAMYGLSGSASKFPCRWCTRSKQEIQKLLSDRLEKPLRTVKSIKGICKQLQIHGSKQLASEFMNVIHEPLWPVPVSRVGPPHLHILLRVVKKHHDLLEDDCHSIDC